MIRSRLSHAVGLLCATAVYAWAGANWEDITIASGIAGFRGTQGSAHKDFITESIGGGCAFLHYDGDGKLDILLVRGSAAAALQRGGDPVIALFRNTGSVEFVDVSMDAGLTARGWGMGVAVADYDNDGRPDIFVTGLNRNFLFHNVGAGRFEEVAAKAVVARAGMWSTGAAFGDIDNDGWLDLYVSAYVDVSPNALPKPGSGPNCIYKGVGVFCGPRGMKAATGALFRNLKGRGFEDVIKFARLAELAPAFYSPQPLIADFDGDGRQDIFVANDSTPNYLFPNLGDWRFAEVGISAGVTVNMDGRGASLHGRCCGRCRQRWTSRLDSDQLR